jgi:uncharacterized membrane protein
MLVYRVHHYAHRVPHQVIIITGTILPTCKRCGDRVRYVPMMPAQPIESDADLASGSAA